MTKSELLRAASLVAVMLAGSCAGPMGDQKPVTTYADGAANHPIVVEPNYRSLKVAFSDREAGLSPEETAAFDGFVQDYIEHGNGAITVSAVRGPGSTETIDYFGSELVKMGVPRDRILVGTHDAAGGDGRVELGYISYVAHTDACGDWSKDADDTVDNLPMPDFGCSVQHNIAAMVADPRDLAQSRPLGPSDASRRTVVLENYEQGKPSSATKTQEQKGAVSDVNNQ